MNKSRVNVIFCIVALLLVVGCSGSVSSVNSASEFREKITLLEKGNKQVTKEIVTELEREITRLESGDKEATKRIITVLRKEATKLEKQQEIDEISRGGVMSIGSRARELRARELREYATMLEDGDKNTIKEIAKSLKILVSRFESGDKRVKEQIVVRMKNVAEEWKLEKKESFPSRPNYRRKDENNNRTHKEWGRCDNHCTDECDAVRSIEKRFGRSFGSSLWIGCFDACKRSCY